MKTLTATAAAAALLVLPSTAFAETLDYDFQMTITSISDGYGVFDGMSEGGTLNVSVLFDTDADWDGVASIDIEGVETESNGYWSNSWSDVQYQEGTLYWDAYSGANADWLVVNDVAIHSGSIHEEAYLYFTETSTGDLELSSGNLSIGVYNGSSAYLTAEYTGKSTSVPELDPKSGTSALALLSGGLILFWSRRRRDDIVPTAG